MRIHPIHRRLATLVVLTALFTAGCATTAKVSRFEDFAAAGTQYTTTLDSLLVASGDVLVDANSDKLLRSAADSRSVATRAVLKEQDEAVRKNLDEIDLLRRQLAVLGHYFDLLSRLATTKAPEVFGAELESTAASLNHLSIRLGSSKLASNKDAVEELAQGLGTLVVRGVQLRALDQELQARKRTIAEVLRLHRALLTALKGEVTHELEIQRTQRYQTQVVTPFVDGKVNADNVEDWKASRRELVRKMAVAKEVDAAAQASQQLQTVWEMLLANKLGAADVQAVVKDLESILAGLGKLR